MSPPPSSCCPPPSPQKSPCNGCCGGSTPEDGPSRRKRDWMLLLCGPLVALSYTLSFLPFAYEEGGPSVKNYFHAVHEFVNATWWGVLIGIVFLSILGRIPREFVMAILGRKQGPSGLLRAVFAGVLLDLCSHGILMVGTKLYERGASLGQVMAFLIASPWNSISLTVILFGMIGVQLTLAFLFFSAVIALISGQIFDSLVRRGVLPANPNRFDLPEDFALRPRIQESLRSVRWSKSLFLEMLTAGAKDSLIVLRWLLFGILLASLLRAAVDPSLFSNLFGPTLLGLLATLVFATVMEVCSEGSAPIAADLVTRAAAPGNGFAFLMAGVSTDYTEIMVLKEATRSWKIALFLPLVTLPQILALAFVLNQGL